VTKQDAGALEKTIQHWRNLADGIDGEPGPGAVHCALCRIHHRWFNGLVDDSCAACPVSMATGLSYCEGTPYGSAEIFYRVSGRNSKEFKAAAVEMHDFLVGLREPKL
jgi:hypothetical protein